MCAKTPRCSCDLRGGHLHWWKDVRGFAHTTNECPCDGQCLNRVAYLYAVHAHPSQASYDPTYVPGSMASTYVSPTQPKDIKLPPMKCVRCDFINEYVGVEHLMPNGQYKCRACKENRFR